MTHREVRVEDDGTHVYADGHRYRPKAPEERVYGTRRPDDPRAVRFHGRWFLPLDLLPGPVRSLPETRPDEETLDHSAGCLCPVCRRPAARALWRRSRRAGYRTMTEGDDHDDDR